MKTEINVEEIKAMIKMYEDKLHCIGMVDHDSMYSTGYVTGKESAYELIISDLKKLLGE